MNKLLMQVNMVENAHKTDSSEFVSAKDRVKIRIARIELALEIGKLGNDEPQIIYVLGQLKGKEIDWFSSLNPRPSTWAEMKKRDHG